MAESVSSRRRDAAQGNYATDENLRKRASLFDYGVATTPQPQLFDLFDWSADATVLDVGCGNGLWTSVAAHRTGEGTVIGLDRSPGMLEAVARRPDPIAPLLADGQQLPLRARSVDIVLAAWVLYHLPDKAAVWAEIGRVLRPSGRLIASTNSAEMLPTLDELFRSCAERVAGHWVRQWIEPLDFTLENGAALLRRGFGRVDEIISEPAFEIPIAEPIITYAESLREPVVAEVGEGFDFAAFLDALRVALDARLADGPIRFTRRIAFFVASDPLL